MDRFFRGHPIYNKNGYWRYTETGKKVSETWKKMGCGYCRKPDTEEGHDGCLGTLPGAMNACCGHGYSNEAYVQFLDGYCIRGYEAIVIQKILKRNKT